MGLGIEASMFKLFGDNGKLNDNVLMHVLSPPYLQHRSALSDCDKLIAFEIAARKAIVIFGYDYRDWPMDPAIDAFETLASKRRAVIPRGRVAVAHDQVTKHGCGGQYEVTFRPYRNG
jgi:hypothetical protein